MWLEPNPRFVPHRWFRGPHRQTIAGAYLWRRRPDQARQHTIQLPDGDGLALHENSPDTWSDGDRAVVLFHGLAGCHRSGYMIRTAHKLVQAGHRVYRLDLRGCGAGMAIARRSVHAGRIDDLAAAADFIKQQCPRAPLTLVGFSLGASMVLRLLGSEMAIAPNVDSAIAVAPPLDLQACSQNLERGWNRIYDRSFVRRLRRFVDQRRQMVPEFDGRTWTRPPASLYEFDQVFTAPSGGFRDVEDYYRQSSSYDVLERISLPTRILFSQDDPLVPVDVFRTARFSSTTQVFGTKAGGHLGFLAHTNGASSDADWHWMDWRIVDWVGEFTRCGG